MRLVRSGEVDVAGELRALVERLGLAAGATSPSSDQRTIELFGQPLPPQEAVRRIVSDVRRRGEEALFHYVEKLDGCHLTPETLWVGPEEMEGAYRGLSEEARSALEHAAYNIRAYQQAILQREEGVLERDGVRIRRRVVPVGRVGVMVPAASAPLPSSLLMCAVPARVAGVEEVIAAASPRPDGRIHPLILAAGHLAGVDRLLRAGGPQAVAALAFGTEHIPRCDKIVGPGNIFVTLAKREVFGEVGIDLLAGPSEVCIIADGSARAEFVAADLIAQAEHAPGAAVLITTSDELAEKVMNEVERQLPSISRPAADFLERFGLIAVVDTLDRAVELANEMAPEHLEVQVSQPDHLLPRLLRVGAVFVGHYSPTALGDYLAGPSHVLPTAGTARFASGLSANDFLRTFAVIETDAAGLEGVAEDCITLARCEGLDAHARSILLRRESTPG